MQNLKEIYEKEKEKGLQPCLDPSNAFATVR